ncbi:MAG: hypothetical protein Q8P45_02850 [Candidatus Harrisonbacteria bacterium]|nr:hypothetical protein [Candidatus Harrisonbacteria bacterium]
MKIFLICSKSFYTRIPDIVVELKKAGHQLTMPNCYDAPHTEDSYREKSQKEHAAWKSEMIRKSEKTIAEHDAVLVLNFEKNGIANYIGGATFLEMYDAFRLGKKIFVYNDLPQGSLKDELMGFQPVILHCQLENID